MLSIRVSDRYEKAASIHTDKLPAVGAPYRRLSAILIYTFQATESGLRRYSMV
jgi:hypothetical protein